MKVLLFGSEAECDLIIEVLKCSSIAKRLEYSQTDNSDELLNKLKSINPDMVIVSSDGAFGMERIIATRKLCPDAMLLWFSNDKDFGAQAYRLNCDYFSVKPVTKQRVLSVIEKLVS
jgi:two-component SAPR family response regulator